MSRSILKGALAFALLSSGCLLLQDPPVNGVGGECEGDDWCETNLVCLRRSGPQNPGECNVKGACYVDGDCPKTSLCQAPSYSVGTCTPNTGCTSDAQCGVGKSCFRGGCWQVCISTLDCGTNATCRTVPCPSNVSYSSCPMACQAF